MPNSAPKVLSEYFPLSGGLDLVTPQISIQPGTLFDAQNYEPEISGGYSRIDGYERYDGHARPTDALYWSLPISGVSGAFAAGQTIISTDNTQSAKVLAVVGSNLILGRLGGVFSAGLPLGSITRNSLGTFFNSAGVFTTVGPNVPRFNYNPLNLSAAPVLLQEATSTNLHLYSEQFDNAVWIKNGVTVVANATAALDGTTNADRIVETGTTASHWLYQGGVVNGSTYTFSVYAKAGERSNLLIFSDNDNQGRNFNLTTGTSSVCGNSPSDYGMVNMGGGVYRCWIKVVATATQNIALSLFNSDTSGGYPYSYSGSIANGLYVWGAQLETGSTPTSYIPTTTVAVNRATETILAQATATTSPQQSGEADPSNDADYNLLAANDYRNDILVVPGSGRIRGVAVYQDTVYAFRDNVGATANLMYKSTSTGWQLVTFGTEILFTTGLAAPVVGQQIKGATSGATATVAAVLLRTGAWSGTGVGQLVLTAVTGTFTSGELLKNVALSVTYATANSNSTAIVRQPGGSVEYTNANFTGSTLTQKMYGCDGVNTAFEFDGTTYVPIRTGMATDNPTHVMFFRFYLFLSFLGSVQYSALGSPYSWTVVLGAGEIALSDNVTGFVPQGGNNAGSTLAIFTRTRVYMLYGSTSANFNLVLSIWDIGYFAGTMQAVSNNTYGLTARGIQSLVTTLTYGDFDYKSVSFPIQPLIFSKRGMETVSTSLRAKDQYRVFFNDGTGIVMGLTGDTVSGMMPVSYGRAVRCITTSTWTNGKERTFFGSDDGYVFEDNIGTSFDGASIESWIRPSFNHSKSPRMRKRYRRSVFDVKSYGFSKVNISYDLGFGNPDILPPEGIVNSALIGGGFWDQFTWESFTWDAKAFSDMSMSLTGTEKNISFLFYSNRAQDRKHTVQGITLMYTPQRTER